MTEKIYDKDPHILKFDAVVLSCEKLDTHDTRPSFSFAIYLM